MAKKGNNQKQPKVDKAVASALPDKVIKSEARLAQYSDPKKPSWKLSLLDKNGPFSFCNINDGAVL
jgi:hypothetical protein